MNDSSNTIREKQTAEEIWLMYFNNYLCENGIITESERNRMVTKIMSRQKQSQKPMKKQEISHKHEVSM